MDPAGQPAPVPDTAPAPPPPGERRLALGQCALNAFEECPNPLPEPATDLDGKRKGGQPVQYCSPRHRDRAAYLRRKAATTATDAGVAHAEHLATRLRPLLEALTAQLTAIADGAVRRAATAEQQAEHAEKATVLARQDTADARTRARAAEQRADAATTTAGTAQDREKAADERAAAAEQRAADALHAERALHTRLTETTSTLRAVQQARDTAEARAASLTEELTETQNRVTEFSTALTAAHVKADEQGRTITELQATLAQTTAAAERDRDSRTRAEAEAQVARAALEQLTRERDDVRHEAARQRERADTAHESATHAQNTATAIAAENTGLREAQRRAEAERDRYRGEADAQRERAAAAIALYEARAETVLPATAQPEPPAEDTAVGDTSVQR